MIYEIKIEYTLNHIRMARAKYLRSFLDTKNLIAFVFLMAIAYFAWWNSYGRETIVAWLAAIIAAFHGYLFVSAWRITRQSLVRYRAMRNHTVEWHINENNFRTKSDLGSVELKWDALSEIWCCPQVWLLFFGPRGSGYSVLPVAEIPIDIQEFIRDRVTAHGGKIRSY